MGRIAAVYALALADSFVFDLISALYHSRRLPGAK
jgi:hypothetical protein